MMNQIINCGLIGAGSRAAKFYLPYFAAEPARPDQYRLRAVLDPSGPARAGLDASRFPGVSLHRERQGFFDAIRPLNIGLVVICSPDFTHRDYIVEALGRELDVIVEKPVVLTASDGHDLLAHPSAHHRVRVAHNFRYLNAHVEIRRLLRSAAIGRVTHVEFAAELTAAHGASYFRRWHRQFQNSGGIFMTKCCHHYDLMNWWLAARPRRVYAVGARSFFHAGRYVAGSPSTLVPDDADIGDTMSAIITYDNDVQVSYSMRAYARSTNNRVTIFGTAGLLHFAYERHAAAPHVIELRLNNGADRRCLVPREAGNHSGADARMLTWLFGDAACEAEPEAIDLAAPSLEQSLQSVFIGDAVNRSIATGSAVEIAQAPKMQGA